MNQFSLNFFKPSMIHSIAVAFTLCLLSPGGMASLNREIKGQEESYGSVTCFTRNDVFGICLYKKDCPEYWVVRSKERRTFRVHENCDFLQICCPSDPKYNFSPELVTRESEPIAPHGFNTGGDNPTLDTREQPPPIIERSSSKIILPSNCSTALYDVRIMGSSHTDIGEFPWMALLEYDTEGGVKLNCGGSLITNWHVLTAGHCSDEKMLSKYGLLLRSVRLGEYDITSNPDCFEEQRSHSSIPKLRCAPKFLSMRIQKTFLHPLYDTYAPSKAHDIALLQLEHPIEFNRYVRPICLPVSENVRSWAVVAGWGKTETSMRSNKLRKVELAQTNRKKCESSYEKVHVKLLSSQLCFGGDPGHDSCDGDSGDPLIQVDYSNGAYQPRLQIIGLASMGPRDCGIGILPGIYTKIYDYIPWIYEKFQLLDESMHDHARD